MKPVRLRVQFRLHSSFLTNQVSSASPCRKQWLNLIRIVQHISIFINNKHESDGVLRKLSKFQMTGSADWPGWGGGGYSTTFYSMRLRLRSNLSPFYIPFTLLRNGTPVAYLVWKTASLQIRKFSYFLRSHKICPFTDS